MGILEAFVEYKNVVNARIKIPCTLYPPTAVDSNLIGCGKCTKVTPVPIGVTDYLCYNCYCRIRVTYEASVHGRGGVGGGSSIFNNGPWVEFTLRYQYLTLVPGSTKVYAGKPSRDFYGLQCGFCKQSTKLSIDDKINQCPSCKNEIVMIEQVNYTPQSIYILEEMAMTMPDDKSKTYMVRVKSPFILSPNQVKEKLGIGYKVLEVNLERDFKFKPIKDVDSAVEMMIQTGYHALVRANHPDLGGDPAVMSLLTRAKKELTELLESVKTVI